MAEANEYHQKSFEESFLSTLDLDDPRNSILKTTLHMIDDNIDHFRNDDGETGQCDIVVCYFNPINLMIIRVY